MYEEGCDVIFRSLFLITSNHPSVAWNTVICQQTICLSCFHCDFVLWSTVFNLPSDLMIAHIVVTDPAVSQIFIWLRYTSYFFLVLRLRTFIVICIVKKHCFPVRWNSYFAAGCQNKKIDKKINITMTFNTTVFSLTFIGTFTRIFLVTAWLSTFEYGDAVAWDCREHM